MLRDISWGLYEQLIEAHQSKSVPHFNYDQGVLEIVSPRREHDTIKWALARVVEVLAVEWSMDFDNVGSTTFRRADLKLGFEADAAFYLANEPFVRDGRELKMGVDPPPDLVIEIDVTHDSMDKLPLYAAMGVPEVWRWVEGRVEIRLLRDGRYEASQTSGALPVVTGRTLANFAATLIGERRPVWERAVRDWARAHSATG